MRLKWIVDVLADLSGFAEKNGMHRFAAAVKSAQQAALDDIAEAEKASGTGG